MAGDSPGNGKARGVEEGGEAVVDQTSLDDNDKSLYELFVAPKGSETKDNEPPAACNEDPHMYMDNMDEDDE